MEKKRANKRRMRIVFPIVGALALLVVLWLSTRAAAGPLGQGLIEERQATAGIVPPHIFYQGRLTDPGTGDPVADGSYAMTFRLYDHLIGGTALATDTHPVTVTNGLFRTYIGFAADNYNGQTLFVGVQVESDPEMSPRHYLRPVPYALSLRPGAVISGAVLTQPTLKLLNPGSGRALYAQAGGANAVRGVNAAAVAAAVVGINTGNGPGGYFSSGGSEALKVDGGASIDGDLTVSGVIQSQGYQNVVVVAKSGGDYTSIQAALDGITDNNQYNRYLVWVAPGLYVETVKTKPYVAIQGSGAGVTVILSTISSSGSPPTATVEVVENVTLRDVTVVVTGTGTHKAAILVRDVPTDTAEIADVVAQAAGGTFGYGIYNYYSAPMIHDVIVTGEGSAFGYGIYNWYSSPTIRDATVIAEGSGDAYGIDNNYASPTIQNSTVTGEGGGIGYGIHNWYSSLVIRNGTVSGDNAGLRNSANGGDFVVTVDGSQLKGGTWAIDSDDEYTVYVGVSLLDGGADTDGTYHCRWAYDGDYNGLDANCQ